MKNKLRNIGIGAITMGAVAMGVYDGVTVSDAEFDEMLPTIQVKGAIVKDMTKYGLNDMEQKLAERIAAGKYPTIDGSVTLEEIQELYASIAIKSGAVTAEEAANGANLYDEIRK